MKLRSLVATFALTAAVATAIVGTQLGSALAATPCVVSPANHFTVNSDNTITGSFTVQGDADCQQPVSVMTWFADSTLYPNPEFFTSQTVNAVQTATFGVGIHTLTVKLPLCSTDETVVHSYQADIIASANPSHTLIPPGAGGFYDQSQANGANIVVDAKIAPGTCPAPKPVPTLPPAAPTTPVTAPPLAAPVAAPAALPNTGAGSVLSLFAVTTVVAACLHQTIVRRRFATSRAK